MLQPHIQLDESIQARCAILPGDPARLDRIALQLENVKEIAYELNFSSTALFSESFRKFYGAPPHAYRSHGGDPGKITEK